MVFNFESFEVTESLKVNLNGKSKYYIKITIKKTSIAGVEAFPTS